MTRPKLSLAKPELTPWFPARINPVREGYYQFRPWLVKGREPNDTIQLAYWGGRKWFYFDTKGMECKALPWRGLASNPKGKA